MPSPPALPESLVRALAHGHLVIFLGPMLGQSLDPALWLHALLADLAAGEDVPPDADLLDLAEWYETQRGRDKLTALLASQAFTGHSPDLDDRVASLGAREIVTTSPDDALERALSRAGRPFRLLVPDQTMTFGPTGPLPVLKLHGDLAAPDRLVLTRRDEEEYERRFPPVRRHLDDLAATSTFLFLGTTLKDPGFARVWGVVGDALRRVGRTSYAVVARPGPHLAAQWKTRRMEVLGVEGTQDAAALLVELAKRAEAARGGPEVSAAALDRIPYEQSWRSFIYKRFRYSETAGLFQFQRTVYRRDVERREVYVEPSVRREQEARERGCPACGSSGEMDPAGGAVCRTKGCPREGKPFALEMGPVGGAAVKLGDLVRHAARAVVLGQPGVGKTSLLQWMAYDLAGDGRLGLGSEAPLPLLLKLRDFVRAMEGDAGTTLESYVGQVVRDQVSDAPDAVVRRWLDDGSVAFLFDGFDEVPSGFRQRVGDEVKGYLEKVPRCAAVLASRPAGYEAAPLGAPFERHVIEELDEKRVAGFLEKWFGVIAAWEEQAEGWAAASAKEMKAALDQRPDLGRLAGNPLLLTLIVLVSRVGKKLPERRAEFYEAALRTLGETWESAKGFGVGREYPDFNVLMRTLGRVAYRLHSTQQDREIGGDTLRGWIAVAFQEDGRLGEEAAERQARAFLEVVRERTGIMVETGPDTYGFVHLGFQEYLAAWHLKETATRGERFEVLRRFLHDPRWEEVLRLLISVLPEEEATAMLREVLDRPSPYEEVLHRDLLFAGRCLTDEPNVEMEMRDDIVAALLQPIGKGEGEYTILVWDILTQIARPGSKKSTSEIVDLLLSWVVAESPPLVVFAMGRTWPNAIFLNLATTLLNRPDMPQKLKMEMARSCLLRGYDPDALAPGWFRELGPFQPEDLILERAGLARAGYVRAIAGAKKELFEHRDNRSWFVLEGAPPDDDVIRLAQTVVAERDGSPPESLVERAFSNGAYQFLARQHPSSLRDAILRRHSEGDRMLSRLAAAGFEDGALAGVARMLLSSARIGHPEIGLRFLAYQPDTDMAFWRERVDAYLSFEIDGVSVNDMPARIFLDSHAERLPPSRAIRRTILRMLEEMRVVFPWRYAAYWRIRDGQIVSAAENQDRDQEQVVSKILYLDAIGSSVERLCYRFLESSPDSSSPWDFSQVGEQSLAMSNLLARLGRQSRKMCQALAEKRASYMFTVTPRTEWGCAA